MMPRETIAPEPEPGSTTGIAIPDGEWEIAISIPEAAWSTALAGANTSPDAPEAICRRAAQATLSGRAAAGAELSIVLGDDAFVRGLNAAYRGKDQPTNVLSFQPAASGGGKGDAGEILLGDVVLAFETVAREAREQGKSLGDHLAHLIVHGCLHLLGHDHENDADAEAMEALEVEILAGLSIADPYRAEIGGERNR